MDKKLFFTDLETTGLDAITHGIIQIGGVIDINGEEKERFNFNIKPFPDDEITDEALKVTGQTREKIQTYQDPKEVYNKLKVIFKKYVDPFKRGGNKFIAVGYNFNFDIKMMNGYFQKNIEEEDPDILNDMYNGFENMFGSDLSEQSIEWLKYFWIKNGDKYFNSFCRNIIDVRNLYTIYAYLKGLDIHKSTRLEDVCKQFNIEIDAHDALSDVLATRELFYTLSQKLSVK